MKAKRYLTLLLAILLAVLLLACDTHPMPPETGGTNATTGTEEPGGNDATTGTEEPLVPDPENSKWSFVQGSNTGVFTDEGYFYLDSNSCIHFLDTSNGIDVVPCAKIGCSHDNSQLDSKGEPIICEAHLLGGKLQFFWEDKLYYTIETDYGIFLYRRNADGTGDEEVTQLGEQYMDQDHAVYLNSMYFVDGILYYNVDVKSIIIDFENDPNHVLYDIVDINLMRMDLRNKKEECILSSEHASEQGVIAIRKNSLIYSFLVIDPEYYKIPKDDPDRLEKRNEYLAKSTTQFILLDLASGEKTVFLEKHFSEVFEIQRISENTMVYRQEEDGQMTLRSLNMDTGEDILLLAGDFYYINEDFCFHVEVDGESEKLVLVDMKTLQPLPTAYQELFMYPDDIGPDGLIMVRRVRPEGSSRNLRIHSYVSFADLEDGLQEEDFADFYTR